MSEYKHTLNLPQTKFPMKASLATREPMMLKRWEEGKLYQAIRDSRKGAAKFILHDGPPYANGHLHCGHALNKILKDIFIKAKTFSGFDAPYVPGWDCHGLPIELNVEKKHGKAGAKLSPREFREKCREYAASQIDIQREEFKRFGVLGDWDNPYATMQFDYEANIIRALSKIVDNGHLQQGFKPVHWCLDCASSLAEAEVEYDDKVSHSIDVRFNVIDTAAIFSAFGLSSEAAKVSFPIWTTTPWTLPSNQAVALNADFDYCLVKLADEYLVLAAELAKDVLARYDVEDYQLLGTVKGLTFEHQLLQHPFFERQVPLIMAAHVSLEAGTGCVHTAPAHGPDDYQVGLHYQLPMDNPVLGNGCYQDKMPLFGGKHVKKAEAAIIELLQDNGCLLQSTKLKHSYPHCWRHKTPVIFRATPQWFISMEKAGLRDKVLAEIKKTQWLPEWGQARIEGMVKNRPDWCISRQRAWGVPIPLFVHKQTGELIDDTVALMQQVADMVEKDGIDAWFELDKATFLGPRADDYEQITDTLDVWFDSGVTHYSVLKAREALQLPADLYLEGSDQHRGWFNSSITTASAIYGHAPFKTVLTHGFTVDKDGKKMSKSKGNYIAPEKLINASGADILRLWVASTDYRGDVHLSDEIYKRTADAYRRIRNTCRFLLSNLFDFDYALHAVKDSEMAALDRYAISQTKALQDAVIKAYDEYQVHTIYQLIHNFCAVDMGSFYLDIIKDRQYTAATDSVARRSCQTAMYHIIESLTRLLAPILSFTADELWAHLPGEREEFVFTSHWYQGFPAVSTEQAIDWPLMAEVRNSVNKAIETKRQAGHLGSGLEANVTLYADGVLHQQLAQLSNELRFVLITSAASVKPLSEQLSSASDSLVEGLKIDVSVIDEQKCARCWHRLPEVGESEAHPELCLRCVSNLDGAGERRAYA